MTDQRPQYGELATPEEQRRAAGLPPIEQDTPVAPVAQHPVAPVASRPAARPAGQTHPVDRFATIALLAYGLLNVIMAGLSYLDLPSVMNESMRLLGIEGEFTNFAAGRTWGVIAALVLAVGWALTAVLSIRRLRRGRLAWWVPLVGAVATMAVVSLCVAVPMFGDPAFADHLTGLAGR